MSFTKDQLELIYDTLYGSANDFSMWNARRGIAREDWREWETTAWTNYIAAADEASRQLDELEGVDTA